MPDSPDPARPTAALWKRPKPAANGPDRSFGGYYRSADRAPRAPGERATAGPASRGMPLPSTEDAMVAAVRMGYRIAEAQIDRGLRWAGDVRDAADRQAGGGETEQVLDAAERLLRKAATLGLQMVETAATDRAHPLRRLIDAELRMLGDWFGREGGAAASEARPAPAAPGTNTGSGGVALRNLAAEGRRRPLRRVVDHAMPATKTDGDIALLFIPSSGGGAHTMRGLWSRDAQGHAALAVDADLDRPAGRWIAGLYGSQGEQLGWIEIEL